MSYGQPNPLIGKTIVGIDIATDKGAIRFRLSDGTEIVGRADGDCCSHTWIESIDTPGAILGSPVTKVEDIEMPGEPQDEKEDDYGDVIAYYGFRITTLRGAAVVDYRNSSNGYYGGNIAWPVAEGEYDSFYGGVHGQNVSSQEWKDVSNG